MPSFDIIAEVDKQEVSNAVNSAQREITNRYDFKGSIASYTLDDEGITLHVEDDMRLKAMQDMLKTYATRRNIDVNAFDFQSPETASGNTLRQKILLRNGIDQESAKKITKAIKDSKSKVQASIRGQELRITGKKRDDLQEAIQLVKEINLPLPLQYTNFRD